MLSVRPSAVIEAPMERVWLLLTREAGFGYWTEAVVVAAEPEGAARPGQQLHVVTRAMGWAFAVTIEVREVDAERRRLRFTAALPFGVVNDQVMSVGVAEGGRAAVEFECDISYPPGWWGWTVRLLARGMRRGPAAALARLKRAAEAPPA
jgi:uncharacterized protein YndB with AHSA1/START domain